MELLKNKKFTQFKKETGKGPIIHYLVFTLMRMIFVIIIYAILLKSISQLSFFRKKKKSSKKNLATPDIPVVPTYGTNTTGSTNRKAYSSGNYSTKKVDQKLLATTEALTRSEYVRTATPTESAVELGERERENIFDVYEEYEKRRKVRNR
jgi:hypothetical protein